MQTGNRLIVLGLFFFSGICGLVYEITWMRMFRLVMGNTVFTAATVLTVFMAGLALGSYLSGRLLWRLHLPLRTYALLEGMIGVVGFLVPLAFVLVKPAYAAAYHRLGDMPGLLALARFAVSGALLIVPTTLMGATLPLLTRFLATSQAHLGRDIGRLYALNTLGGALGAALTGFELVPALGVRTTIHGAVAVNLLICAAAFWLSRQHEQRDARVPSEANSPVIPAQDRGGAWLVLLGLGGAGAASMIYEVAWTRVLSMIIGSSVYAFTLMLVAFITGLGLGSLVFASWVDRRAHLRLTLGKLEAIVGLAALAVVPVFGMLPGLTVELVQRFAGSFILLHALEFLSILTLMLVPTLAMGAVFPVVSRLYTRHLAHVGRSVGEAYAANTLGAVVGSFIGGFLLIPWCGVQQSIAIAVGLNVLIGVYFIATSQWRNGRARGLLAGLVVACAVLGVTLQPRWDVMVMNSAPYLYASRYMATAERDHTPLENVMTRNRRLLYAEEGLTATVTVVESGGQLFLKVNGKTDASSGGDLRSQSLLSHLPLLLHPAPAHVLLVGLGSGISLGSALQHPVDQVDCLEISPEVVSGARFFHEFNHDALDDERVRLIIGDGRNHVSLSTKQYDVIISQPSNLWIAGMADLFTREYFSACRARLAPGGVVCSWVQAYAMGERDFRTIVQTFGSVFPHATLWESVPGGDYFLIGSEAPLVLDPSELRARFHARSLESDFLRIGALSLDNLLCSYVFDSAGLHAFAGTAPVNTDDNAILEFSVPTGLYGAIMGEEGAFGLASLRHGRQRTPDFVTPAADSLLTAAWAARQAALQGIAAMNRGDLAAAVQHMDRAYRANPEDMELRRAFPLLGFRMADLLEARNQHAKAFEILQQVLEVVPDNAMAEYRLGRLLEHFHRGTEALPYYERALRQAPHFLAVYPVLAEQYANSMRLQEAEETYLAALALAPTDAALLNQLGRFYLRRQLWDKAVAIFQRAWEAHGEEAQTCNNLGVALFQRGDMAAALDWFARAVRLDPEYVLAYNNLGDAHRALGDSEAARRAWEKVLDLDPRNARALHALQVLGRR